MSLLLFISLVSLACVLGIRWWQVVRVLETKGSLKCRCDLSVWTPAPGDSSTLHRADGVAGDFGMALRAKALSKWHDEQPKLAGARESVRRFGVAVPPLTLLILIFAVLVGKTPVLMAISVWIAVVVLTTAYSYLGLAPELAAIGREVVKAKKTNSFPVGQDLDSIASCAVAHAWNQAVPPLLRLWG